MARRLALALLLFVAGAACGGEPAASPSPPLVTTSLTPNPSTTSPASSPSASSPTPSLAGEVRLPPDAPRTLDEDVDARDLTLDTLAPPGARIGSSWRGDVLTPSSNATAQAAAFSWSRGDAFEAETGVEIWERSDTTSGAPWRVVFAFTDQAHSGVLGVRFETGDVTGDRSPDLLSFEDLGGSGACGIWRVIAATVGSYLEIYRAQTCDTEIRIADGDLLRRAAVYEAGDAHCCPSAFRITRLHWNGEAWQIADRSTEPA